MTLISVIIPTKNRKKLLERAIKSVINKTYKLKVSYHVEEGNPHNYYTEDQFDFKKPPIRVEASGVDILISEKNNLEFMVNERDWSLKVRGFDVDAYHRELRINLN